MADKMPVPIQYNRPVTKARPQDPRRFESHDVHSADAQQDPVYQKMVQDIEALQQRQGWLAGRGAFDKDDLLYLKHKQEEERLREQEQRESEAAAFAAARARAAQQEAVRSSSKQLPKELTKQGTKAMQLQTLVKVKPHSRDHTAQTRQLGQQSADLPDAKRPKLEPGDPVTEYKAPYHNMSRQAAGQKTSSQAEVTHPEAAAVERMQQETGLLDSGAVVSVEQQHQHAGGGLESLLGGYGSDDDDSEDAAYQISKVDTQQQEQQLSTHDAQEQLPSAAKLLEGELSDGNFVEAHKQHRAAAAGALHDNERRIDGPGPVYGQHGSWV